MKICIGNDHHGIEVKNKIIKYLKSKNISYEDYGPLEKNNVDYIDYALKVCDKIKKEECSLGILICGTGIGMSIAANKINGIYCAKVNNEKEALLCREHNQANVIALGENIENVEKVIDFFINTNPSTEQRHIRRFEKIKKIEGEN